MYAPRWERDDGDGSPHGSCSLPLLAELPAHVVAKAVGGSPLSPGTPPGGSTRTERYIHRTPAILRPDSPHAAIHHGATPPVRSNPPAHLLEPPGRAVRR